MVFCGSSKPKSNTKAKQPLAQTTPVEDKKEAAEAPVFQRQKSFYQASEDVYPVKVDFLKTNNAKESAEHKKQRFVVLTDSALIIYDELEHPSTGHYNFQTQHFLFTSISISSDKDNEITIKDSVDNRYVTLTMRNSKHKEEWTSVLKKTAKDHVSASKKAGIKSSDISFDMDENLQDDQGQHETPVRAISAAI